ncbi:MAG: hypothetical protein FGM57_03615 [Candidatus Taylorbacteria bacterium]|nr:hypothetical protein [Candidatus Taylorbacteria bacterium]
MIFFGTSTFSTEILTRLEELGIVPTHIVTVPDRPQGRKMILTPPPAKVWATERDIPVFQFEKLKPYQVTLEDDSVHTIDPVEVLQGLQSDLFIVASYGKIIPQNILDIPKFGALNVHPSLLPKYRGASPLQSTLLHNEQKLGVCIIKMDALMDHGPIAAVEYLTPGEGKLENWPLVFGAYEKVTARIGAELIHHILPSIYAGTHEFTIQNHDEATFTSKISKEDGHIKELTEATVLTHVVPLDTYLKFCALNEWPGVHFFRGKNGMQMRIKISEMSYDKNTKMATILKVVPEGKKEMSWKDLVNFLR